MNMKHVLLGSKIQIFKYIILHILFLFYSFGGVVSKLASKQPVMSFKFIFSYGILLIILFIYAILWQQILKHLPLTIAFSNKAITIIWGMIWGFIFFGETITWNMLLGASIVILGICLVVKSDEK